MNARTLAALAGLLCLAGAASLVAAQGDTRPKAWTPASARERAAADSARAANAPAPPPPPAEPTEHVVLPGPGMTRTIDLQYQPSVPDSILPLAPVYRVVPMDGAGTVYVGALRQDIEPRPYPVVLKGMTLSAQVDGDTGQTHAAVMVMLPWFGDILPLAHARITLGVKIDDGAEQEWKLECTPGPNFYIPSQRPLPVSNPGLLIVPLPAGPHRLAVRVKQNDASYALMLLAQPRLTPLGVERRK